MELAIKRENPNLKAELRALVNGQYAGDANALIEKLAADLLAGVVSQTDSRLSTGKQASLTSKAVRKEVASRLAEWLIRDNSQEITTRPSCLSVTRWSPEEVVEQTGISKSTLYRSDHAQFYSVVPPGKKTGRAYPAWQFSPNVLEHLPQLLGILRSNTRMQVNTFFMSEQELLDELTPAEVLAGLPFEARSTMGAEQVKMLALPSKVRLDKIVALAKIEVADLD